MPGSHLGAYQLDARCRSHRPCAKRLGIADRHRAKGRQHTSIMLWLSEVERSKNPGLVFDSAYGRLHRWNWRVNRVLSALLQLRYWHMPIKEEERNDTTFVTHRGAFRWIRMPFAVRNVPVT